MKQYCRYCVHLFTGNGIWCEEKKVEMRETTAKSVNHCDSFEFCEMDAFFETDGYRPRGKRTPTIDEIGDNQLRMEEPT